MRIILASTSPRRKEMMEWLDIPYETAQPDVDESKIRSSDPAELTRLLATAKAKAVADVYADAIIIGSDAIVAFENQIIEKPVDIDDQRKMIYKQMEKPASVFSSICIINTATNENQTLTLKTEYVMAKVSDDVVERYIESGKGMDKAGGYGQQDEGGVFVQETHGCYPNSIGFPICRVSELLSKMGVEITVDIKKIVQDKTGRTC
jgi:septum formation protein